MLRRGPAPGKECLQRLIHHGDNDVVVPLAMDQRLAVLLSSRGRRHELHV